MLLKVQGARHSYMHYSECKLVYSLYWRTIWQRFKTKLDIPFGLAIPFLHSPSRLDLMNVQNKMCKNEKGSIVYKYSIFQIVNI